jgi:hypothetical protein
MPCGLHVVLRTVNLDYHSLVIIVHRNIAGIGFSITGKFIRSSQSHSASTPPVSNAMNSASIVDLVKMVYLQDFQETMPPPSKNAYPLMV